MSIFFYETPVGKLCIEENIGYITYINNSYDEFIKGKDICETSLIKETKKQLDEYFNGDRKEFSIPIKHNGSAYLMKIWQLLCEIPYGEVITYKEIAARAGNPKAARAAGMGCGKNNILILTPCHRVIGSDGSLTGFGGGLSMKEKLILLENKNFLIKNKK